MNTLRSSLLEFASHIMDGEEGVFFTDGENCFFANGVAEEADFDGDQFPVFCAFDFWGKKKTVRFRPTGQRGLLQDIPDLWIDRPETFETCSNETKSSFLEKVEAIQEAQKDGEMWVMNLTHELSGECENKMVLLAAYDRFLREEKPHIGGVWWTKDLKFASFSPEMFLRHDNYELTTCPIKGTGNEGDLEQSEKEQSELYMVTDLLRNDLGQITEKVWVEKERVFSDHKAFFHTHSEIKGRMRSDHLSLQSYQQLLPAGSVSGCPKHRVCQFIEKLESYERGFYTGTFGVKMSKTESVFNVLIRTLFFHENRWIFPVGAGITHRSVGEEEWRETCDKIEYLAKYIFSEE